MALAGCLVLFAFGLRLVLMASQSLWLDEGDSVAFAQRDLVSLARSFVAISENGPLYFLFLHFWIQLAGTSELSLRFPSAVAGTLTVPIAIVFGRRLVGRSAGLILGVLVAGSHYLVWYSREVRMYSIVVLLSLLASYLLVRGLQQHHRMLWIGYVATLSLLLYVHLFTVFLILFHGFFILLYTVWVRRISIGALLSLGFLTLPYLPLAMWQLPTWQRPPDTSYQFHFLPLEAIAVTLLSVFSVSVDRRILIALAALAGVGLISTLLISRRPPVANRWSRPLGGVFVALHLAVPVLSYYVVSLRLPAFYGRYLSVILPAYYCLLAVGIVGLGRLFRPLGVIALAGVLVLWLPPSLDGSAQKEDWRAAAAYTRALARPADLFLFVPPNAEAEFRYYLGPAVPAISIPLRTPAEFATETVPGSLAQATPGHRGVWLVQSHVGLWPTVRAIEDWLSAHGRRLSQEQWQAHNPVNGAMGITISYFLLDDESNVAGPGAPGTPPLATFDDRLELRSWSSEHQPARAGESLALTFFWQARTQLPVNYRLSLRLVDDRNRVWGQVDQEPAGRFFPSTQWPAGKAIRSIANLPIDPGAPAGTYTLKLIVYGRTSEPVGVTGRGQAERQHDLVLARLAVVRPSIPPEPGWKPAGEPFDADFGGQLRLLSVQSPAEAAAGQPLKIATYWRVLRRLDRLPQLRVGLRRDQTVIAEGTWPLAAGDGPWLPGEVIRSDQELPISPGAEAGPVALTFSARTDGASIRPRWHGLPLPWTPSEVAVQRLMLKARPREFAVPHLDHVVGARFEQGIRLLGYQMAEEPVVPGRELRLTLFWQAESTVKSDYTAFVHVAQPGKPPVAQRDEPPGGGQAPTSSWLPGEVIRDEKRLQIPAVLPPGPYQLLVGLFDSRTEQRLPAEGGGSFVVLATFSIP